MGNCVSAKKIPQRDNYLDNYNGQFVPQVKFVDAYSVSQPETVSATSLPDGIQNKNLSDKPRQSVQPSKENTNPHVVLGEVVSKHDVLYDYTHTHPDLASSLNTMMTIIELLANCSADVLADNKQLTQILSKVKLLGLFCSGEPENVKVFASFLADIDVVPVFKDVIQKLYNEHPAIVERNHGQNSAENYKVEDPAENDGLLGDTTDSENALVFIAQSIFDNLICAAHKLTSFHYALCLACREKGLVPILLEISKALAGNVVDEDWEPKNEDEATNIVTHIFYSTLGTLYNIARRTGPTHLFNDFRSFVPTLLTWATTKGAHFGTESILCLAYLIDEQNNHLIENQKGIIQFLVDTLDAALNSTDRKSFNFSASELAAGLSQLASNDTNKRTLGACGAVKTLVKMIDTVKDKEEERSAATALWILAFDEQNKILIKREERALRLLHTLAKSSNSKVQKAAAGVLWEIEGRQARNQARRSGGSIDQSIGPGGSTHQQQQQHVMISYQWDVQNVVKEVKNRLQAAGYSVWMDIDDMGGSTLESMAGAVEDACAVLVCVSQKYKDSPNCRSEAEYAFQVKTSTTTSTTAITLIVTGFEPRL